MISMKGQFNPQILLLIPIAIVLIALISNITGIITSVTCTEEYQRGVEEGKEKGYAEVMI